MARRALIVALALAGLLPLPGSTPMASALEPSAFTMYASCSTDGGHHSAPTHVCRRDEVIRAVLRYGGAPVEYKVCVRQGRRTVDCDRPAFTEPGKSSIALVLSRNVIGPATVSWYVGATEIGSYEMRFVKYPAVPPFGISPLIVSGTHRLFGLIVRHVPAGLRARAWRVCNRGCPLPLKLVAGRGETRRYRITGSRRNSTFSLGDLLFVLVDAPGRRVKGSELWGRLYRGKLVRDRQGGPGDTAVHRIDPPLCNPPGLPFGFSRDCREIGSPAALADLA